MTLGLFVVHCTNPDCQFYFNWGKKKTKTHRAPKINSFMITGNYRCITALTQHKFTGCNCTDNFLKADNRKKNSWLCFYIGSFSFFRGKQWSSFQGSKLPCREKKFLFPHDCGVTHHIQFSSQNILPSKGVKLDSEVKSLHVLQCLFHLSIKIRPI